MKTSDMIQSKYLKKEDFETPQILTIKDVSLEEVGKEGDTRWVMHFREQSKGVVLNVTKIRKLEANYGNDSDMWMGKKVKLYHDPDVMFAGKVTGGIGMVLPKAVAATPVQKAEVAHAEFEDEIPF